MTNKVVVGLGFGDEGKGRVVDWLCAQQIKDKKNHYIMFVSQVDIKPDIMWFLKTKLSMSSQILAAGLFVVLKLFSQSFALLIQLGS